MLENIKSDTDDLPHDEDSSLNSHRTNPSSSVITSSFASLTLARAQSNQVVHQKSMMNLRGSGSSTVQLYDAHKNAKVPATYVMHVMEQVPVDPRLVRGIPVTKVTSRGKFRPRVLTISRDRFALFCTHRKITKGNSDGTSSSVARKLPVPLFSRKGIHFGFNNSREQALRELYVRYLDITDIDYINVGVPCTRRLEAARTTNRLKGIDDKRVDKRQNQILSITHHGGLDTLDVFVHNETDLKLVVSTLQALRQAYHDSKVNVDNESRLLRYIWYDIDANQDGYVSEPEFEKILARINLSISTHTRRKVYTAYQTKHALSGPLTYNQCMELLTVIKEGNATIITSPVGSPAGSPTSRSVSSATVATRTSLPHVQLWDSIFGPDKVLVTAQEFMLQFLHPIQREMDAKLEDVKNLFQSLNHMEVIGKKTQTTAMTEIDTIDKQRFSTYLHHIFNMAYDPDQQELNPKLMTKSITEYWINSSHNTYLVGDQLRSMSSVEMYMAALHRGCKCLELDCWDGDVSKKMKEPLPIVFHGGTLTGKILFQDVIHCINNYIDAHPNTYPIILSIENHCSNPFQLRMAQILKVILKEKLYTPFASDSTESLQENDLLPSPEELKGRVLIKGKRPPADVMDVENDFDDDFDVPEGTHEQITETAKKSKRTKLPEKSQQPLHSKIVRELAELTLFHGCKFKKWDTSISLPPSHMHSIGESKITKLIQKGGAKEWREYNKTHLTRTYPAGTRIDSSNYNPILAWSMGSQLVALNFQTSDSALILNDGRFRQNGNCGYVLKPPGLLVGPTDPILIKIRILSGSCLPKPHGATSGETIDPYLQVTLHDVQNKDGKEGYKATNFSTSTIQDNGFYPVWQGSTFWEFRVHSPHVAMIQFSLLEADVGLDDKVADASIPVLALRKGYRSIRMHNENGTRSGPFGFATILAEIQC